MVKLGREGEKVRIKGICHMQESNHDGGLRSPGHAQLAYTHVLTPTYTYGRYCSDYAWNMAITIEGRKEGEREVVG